MKTDKDNTRFCPECFRTFPAEAMRCSEHGVALVDLPSGETMVGKTIDQKYEVVEKVGRGGMGTVYHVRQKFIGRDLAIKVLRPEFAKDVQAIQRFFTEVRAACQLRSRHCVMVHDFGLSKEGHLYFTMELLRGRPLTRLLKEGPLELDRAVRIATDICLAMEEAHGNGIVHRDLKPDNVMLVRDKEGSHAKVLDFGIAKLLTEQDGVSLTQAGMVCGTPEYMSPEQARGDALGFASDLYSLGIVLYEMLAGLPPFRAHSPMRVLLKHINEEPHPIRVVSPDVEVPLEFERFLLQMLAKDPADRPESAAAVRFELERILEATGERVTTSLPHLLSSSDGVRRVTASLLESEDFEAADTVSAAPKSEGGETPTRKDSIEAVIEDQEPGAETRAVVGVIGGQKRRLRIALVTLISVGLIMVLGFMSGVFRTSENKESFTEGSATSEAPALSTDTAVSSGEITREDIVAEDLATEHPEAENLTTIPDEEGEPETGVALPRPEPITSAPLVHTIGQESRMEDEPPNKRADETRPDTRQNQPKPTEPSIGGKLTIQPVEPEHAAGIRESGLRYKTEGKFDAAIRAFREAKEKGGDPGTLDRLIEECKRLRDDRR